MINKRRPRLGFNGFHKHNTPSQVSGSDALTDLIAGPQSLVDGVRDSHVDKTGSALPQSASYPLNVAFRLFVGLISLVALSISVYLSYVAFTSSKVVGCGGSMFDCSHVLTSQYSKVAGIPVGAPAALLYLAIVAAMAMTLVSNRPVVRRSTMLLLTFGAFAAAIAAGWFIYLQFFVIKKLCLYCLAAHTCGLILAAIVLWKRPMGWKMNTGAAGFGCAAVAVLATIQLTAEPEETFVIKRHDVPAVATEEAAADETFGAPVEAPIFEAPFAAPGMETVEEPKKPETELFEAPGQETTSEDTVDENNSAVPSDDHTSQSDRRRCSTASLKVRLASLLVSAHSGSSMIVSNAPQDDENQDDAAEKKDEPRIVRMSGNVTLNAAHWPLVGANDARYMFVEMYDYTCPHCRETHEAIKGAKKAMGNDLAILVLPVPMKMACNPYVSVDHDKHRTACDLSKISVAVWRVDPSKFTEFHDWMFDGAAAPTVEAAKSKAKELVDAEKFDAEYNGSIVSQYIAKHAQLYNKVGGGAIPKMLFPGTSVIGKYTSSDGLVELIKREAK